MADVEAAQARKLRSAQQTNAYPFMLNPFANIMNPSSAGLIQNYSPMSGGGGLGYHNHHSSSSIDYNLLDEPLEDFDVFDPTPASLLETQGTLKRRFHSLPDFSQMQKAAALEPEPKLAPVPIVHPRVLAVAEKPTRARSGSVSKPAVVANRKLGRGLRSITSCPDMTKLSGSAASMNSEEMRRQRRLARNRLSAKNRRLAKKTLTVECEADVKQLEHAIALFNAHSWGTDQPAVIREALATQSHTQPPSIGNDTAAKRQERRRSVSAQIVKHAADLSGTECTATALPMMTGLLGGSCTELRQPPGAKPPDSNCVGLCTTRQSCCDQAGQDVCAAADQQYAINPAIINEVADEGLELEVMRKLLNCLSQPKWSDLQAVDTWQTTVKNAIGPTQLAKLIQFSELNAQVINSLPLPYTGAASMASAGAPGFYYNSAMDCSSSSHVPQQHSGRLHPPFTFTATDLGQESDDMVVVDTHESS